MAEKENVVELLLAAHHRILRFLELASRLAGVPEMSPSDLASTANTLREYFQHALPLHETDEALSLWPRLLGQDPALDEVIRQLEKGHGLAEVPRRGIVDVCRYLARAPQTLPTLAVSLREHLKLLKELLAHHMGVEERLLFPRVAALPPAALDEVLAEMRKRRSEPFPD
ncbi:MAG: Hemerythrin cation binding domain protein [Myxococcaceae bacterium]|nr:Hemerythrin cation binding domain protein [Myxococcaceae bacterium]